MVIIVSGSLADKPRMRMNMNSYKQLYNLEMSCDEPPNEDI